jgi:hypothetical protein
MRSTSGKERVATINNVAAATLDEKTRAVAQHLATAETAFEQLGTGGKAHTKYEGSENEQRPERERRQNRRKVASNAGN